MLFNRKVFADQKWHHFDQKSLKRASFAIRNGIWGLQVVVALLWVLERIRMHPSPSISGPKDSPVAVLDGSRPRRHPFIVHCTRAAFLCPAKPSSKRELLEGRINLLNSNPPAPLLMECHDLGTCRRDRTTLQP